MKRTSIILVSCAALIFFPGGFLFAQHGHPGGMGMGHAGGMGMGPSNPGPGSHGPSTRGNPNATTPTNSSGGKTVGDLLTQNTKLSSNLQNLLPPGTDLQTAASGFKNLGQFVAAVHVSHNLGIRFDTLKGKVTGRHSVSLGKAIHQLDPKVNANSQVKTANKQAKQDIKASHS